MAPEAREWNGEQDAAEAAAEAAAAGAMAADSGDSDSSDDSDSDDGEDIDVDADTAQRLMALEHELQSNPSYEKYIEVGYKPNNYFHVPLPTNWAMLSVPLLPHTPS